MKKLIIILAVSLAFIATPVLAVEYYCTVMFAETAGTTYTAPLAVLTPFDTAGMVTNGYMDANGLDTDLRIGATDIPHLLADDKLLFAYPLPASSSNALYFYTDQTPALSMAIITGHDGYITTLEAAALRLGDKWSIEQNGYVDTSVGATKNLVYKQNAYQVYVSAANTITATFNNGVSTTETLAPSGAGSETAIITLVGAATHWQANLTNDGDVSYVGNNNSGVWQRDLYATTDTGIGAGAIANVSVNVVARWRNAGAGAGASANTSVKTNGVVYDGVGWNLTDGVYNLYTTNYALNPQTTTYWTWAEVNAMEIGVKLATNNAADFSYGTQVYAVVTYYPAVTVSITPVPSAEYTVRSYCDGAWFMLSLNGDVSWDTIHSNRVASGGASVVVTATNWIIGQNNVMPYINYYSHSVDVGAGLVLIAHYHPENIIAGTVLPDLVAPAQNGAITWGTNPVGVQVIVGALVPTVTTSTTSRDLVDPDAMGEMVVPEAPQDTALQGEAIDWLQPIIRNIANDVQLPITILWVFLAGCSICLWIRIVFEFFPHTGLAMIGVIVIFGAHISMAIMPFWVIFVPVSVGLFMLTMERSPSL